MKFLVDAQLPKRLASSLFDLGHDAIHTLDRSDGNRTSDSAICQLADDENRIVISKDRDFVDSYLLNSSPAKLLLVSTGNISNNDLIQLFADHITALETGFGSGSYLELGPAKLTIHE